MKYVGMLSLLFVSLSSFVCGGDHGDLAIVDPRQKEFIGSPSSLFYYRHGLNSPKTTSVDFDPRVVVGREVNLGAEQRQIAIAGRKVNVPNKAPKKVTFAPGTKLPKEKVQTGLLGSLINWFL